MTTATVTIQSKAAEASKFFTRTKRGDDTIVTLKDERPEWVLNLVREAHGDMMPDDYRYSVIEEALDAIADAGEDADLDDVGSEFADDVDIYTSELTGWLHSRTDRYGYVDEALKELGPADDTIRALQAGQYQERQEVFGLVREALEKIVDAEDKDNA